MKINYFIILCSMANSCALSMLPKTAADYIEEQKACNRALDNLIEAQKNNLITPEQAQAQQARIFRQVQTAQQNALIQLDKEAKQATEKIEELIKQKLDADDIAFEDMMSKINADPNQADKLLSEFCKVLSGEKQKHS